MKIITREYFRDYVVDRGNGAETVRWSAWRASCPKVRGYGQTEEEAIDDLVHFVQPLDGGENGV